MSDDDYPGGWFGPSWGAPVCDPEKHKDTPAGQACMYCMGAIRDGDQGLAMPSIVSDQDGRFDQFLTYVHLDCFLKDIGAGK